MTDAQRRVDAFERQYGSTLLALACHAALPVVLSPDLLHVLRVNYFLDPPDTLSYADEARLLLSPLCGEVDQGLYVIDPEVRDVLLVRLLHTNGSERIRDLAQLLWEFGKRGIPWPDRPGLVEAQRLTALSFIDPAQAWEWLDRAEAGAGSSEQADQRWSIAMRHDLEARTTAVADAEAEIAAAATAVDPPETPAVDVLIITALKEEFDAVRRAAPEIDWQEYDRHESQPYLYGQYSTPIGRILSIALARPVRAGVISVGSLAARLARRLRPGHLVRCGVCSGNPSQVALGDVVVADMVQEYDEGMNSRSGFEGDSIVYGLDPVLATAALDLNTAHLASYGAATEREATIWFLERLLAGQEPRDLPARERYFPRGTWQPRLAQIEEDGLIEWRGGRWALTQSGTQFVERSRYDDIDGPTRLPFAVRVAPMVSRVAVRADRRTWEQLRWVGSLRAAAIDLDAATIAAVALQHDLPWLVVKGVIDYADGSKDDHYSSFAARASAEVAFAVIAAGTRIVRKSASGRLSGKAKLEFAQRLGDSWNELADFLGVPRHAKARFPQGDEARELWEWLEVRNRLRELPAVLDEIGREDLSVLLRQRD
ncbi:hypothetical protein Val02_05030 [Virgisporangium aliadipatigenens]|uniref:Nucleoside phosphorylase domain-containing protein n=1 Tax=Virgisporangium aliadipatigenens TaxID=741659 RepID=A0A8J4DNK9_9ACTN|nr:hypothetical protein [Virgisporangium aliadipatigenens]GIJ43617.1 hypothetical protein Val02_05030 [Virgisporangium aliadipatigenens]